MLTQAQDGSEGAGVLETIERRRLWGQVSLSAPVSPFLPQESSLSRPRTTEVLCQHTRTQSFNGRLSGTTRVGQYEKKHSPTHTRPDHISHPISANQLRSIESSLFNLPAWQSFSTTSFQALFGLPLCLGSSASYFIHFFSRLCQHSVASKSLLSICQWRDVVFSVIVHINWVEP